MPLQFSHLFDELGVTAPKGILLTGTTGCGKTYLAKALCHDLFTNQNLSIFIKHGAEFMTSLSGESEKNIRQLFDAAIANAPSLVFLDEIDVIAGSRDKATKEMERRVVS
jgi:ATP-dependent 26S proteasome regulatory subunit